MVRDTPPSKDASTYQICDSYFKECKKFALDTIILETRSEFKVKVTIILETRSEFKVKVTVSPKWYTTLPFQDACTHHIWDSYLKEYRRYAPDMMRILESRSEVKVKITMTQECTRRSAIPGCMHTPDFGFLPQII